MSKHKVIEDANMTVGEHLNELRNRIVKSVVVLIVIAGALFLYKGIVLDVVFAPMHPDFPTNRFLCRIASETGMSGLCINNHDVNIVNMKMAGQFMLHVKSSLIGAVIIAFPFLIWQLWMFIRPALSFEIIRQCRRIVFQISLWFFIGIIFGYYVIAPLTVNFLTGYQVSQSIDNMIDVSSFLGGVLGVSLAAAVIFQLPVLVRLLATIGVLTSDIMRKYRKISIVVIFIVAAIITPPDVFSQTLIAIPLLVLYEYGIRTTARIEKKLAAQNMEIGYKS